LSSSEPSSQSKSKYTVPPIVRRLGWVSFLTDIAAEMVYPLLPALLRSFGGAALWLGVMEGIAEAASAFVKWRIGPIVDRSPKKKPLIVIGYTLATFSRPLLAFASMGLHVVLLRSLDRIGKGIRGVPRDAMLAESVEKTALARAFAFHRMMDNAGSVLGPIVAFGLLRLLAIETRTVIMLAVIPGLASVLVLLLGVREPAVAVAAERKDVVVVAKSTEPLPSDLKRYLAILALFTLGSSADSFLLLRATEIGISAAWLPIMWLSLSLAKTASNMPGGWIADRYGRKRTLVFAWILYAAFYAIIPYVKSPPWFAAVVIAYGAYYGLAEGSERALLTEHAPPHLRGRAFGAMHALTGIAVLPANLAFGFLYTRSPGLAFGISGAAAAVAAVLLAFGVEQPVGPGPAKNP